MARPNETQLLLLAATLLAGMGLGLVYDLLRVVRERAGGVAGFLADLSFCLLFGLSMLALGMGPAAGELRFFMPPLALGGALLWFAFFGKAARNAFGALFSLAAALLRAALFPLGLAAEGIKKLLEIGKKWFTIIEKWFTITGKAALAHRKAAARARIARRKNEVRYDEAETGKHFYKNRASGADRLRGGNHCTYAQRGG